METVTPDTFLKKRKAHSANKYAMPLMPCFSKPDPKCATMKKEPQVTLIKEIQTALHRHACPKHAAVLQHFFKTGPGEYGAGDIFIGVRMPDIRKTARAYRKTPLASVQQLLESPIHEERLCALVILTEQFARASAEQQKEIYMLYLEETAHINNWDLVDVSAHKIVGAYLYTVPRAAAKKTLQCLALSHDLWERRIAIIATAFFIQHDRFGETLGIAQMLRNDSHDLIHKATGWMLREVGNRDRAVEEKFLRTHYKTMPRTMLRYAIEKFPEGLRQKYLKGLI